MILVDANIMMYAAGSDHPNKAPSIAFLDVCPDLMARDALHAAVAEIHSLSAICSFDRDFDQISEIRRVQPPL